MGVGINACVSRDFFLKMIAKTCLLVLGRYSWDLELFSHHRYTVLCNMLPLW